MLTSDRARVRSLCVELSGPASPVVVETYMIEISSVKSFRASQRDRHSSVLVTIVLVHSVNLPVDIFRARSASFLSGRARALLLSPK